MPAVLGVLGGMGPLATADFLRLLAERHPAGTDQEHPRVIVLSDPSVPDRTASLLAGDDAPLAPIAAGLRSLTAWGADLLAVPCNTAHAYVDRLDLEVPVVHIVDAALDAAVRTAPGGAWLLASTGTVRTGLYQRRAAARGYPLRTPGPAGQRTVHEALTLVKAGDPDAAGWALRRVVHRLWQRAPLPVLAGCTELPIAYAAAALPPQGVLSCLEALADACLAALGATAPATAHPAA